MNAKMKLMALLGGAALLGGIGGGIARDYQKPRYYWYDVAQVDSLRDILNRVRPARLKLEERTKDHIWFTALPLDTVAARMMALPEVEESWPCPPNCLK